MVEGAVKAFADARGAVLVFALAAVGVYLVLRVLSWMRRALGSDALPYSSDGFDSHD